MDLFVQYGDGKKRRKPNYSSVDLSEVEWEDKDDTVKLFLYIKSTLSITSVHLSIEIWLWDYVLPAEKCHGQQEDRDILHGGEEECRQRGEQRKI